MFPRKKLSPWDFGLGGGLHCLSFLRFVLNECALLTLCNAFPTRDCHYRSCVINRTAVYIEWNEWAFCETETNQLLTAVKQSVLCWNVLNSCSYLLPPFRIICQYTAVYDVCIFARSYARARHRYRRRVRLSVTRWYWRKTNNRRIIRFSSTGSVFLRLTFVL